LSAVTGRDKAIPAVLFLDQAQLGGEVDGGLGLEALDYLMGFTVEKDEFDAA
jgi:hypothetical protein